MSKGKWFAFSTSTGVIRGFANLEYEYAPGEKVLDTDGISCPDCQNFSPEFLGEIRRDRNTLFDLPKGITMQGKITNGSLHLKTVKKKWWHD